MHVQFQSEQLPGFALRHRGLARVAGLPVPLAQVLRSQVKCQW